MANTFSQLYVQMVFAVKNRQSLILGDNKDKIEKYIWGISSNIKCKPIAIYCNPDLTHLLVSIKPVVCIANAIRDIKWNIFIWLDRLGCPAMRGWSGRDIFLQ